MHPMLSRVLMSDLAESRPGRPVCLVARDMGRKIGDRVAELMEASAGGLFLDFGGVEFLDYAAADEIVGRMLARLLGGDFGERYLVLGSLADGPREVVQRTLHLRGLAVLHLKGYRSGVGQGRPADCLGSWECLGALPDASAPILAQVLERGTATADELAETLQRAPALVTARLRRLYLARLVARPDRPTRGKRPIYGRVGGSTGELIDSASAKADLPMEQRKAG